MERGLYVRNGKGQLPYEDVVLDFTNPETVKWYQEKLGNLIEMGVSAIKVDFGEGAPLDAIYANGRSGLYEHNLPAALQQNRGRHHQEAARRKHHLGTLCMGRLTTLSAALGR